MDLRYISYYEIFGIRSRRCANNVINTCALRETNEECHAYSSIMFQRVQQVWWSYWNLLRHILSHVCDVSLGKYWHLLTHVHTHTHYTHTQGSVPSVGVTLLLGAWRNRWWRLSALTPQPNHYRRSPLMVCTRSLLSRDYMSIIFQCLHALKSLCHR